MSDVLAATRKWLRGCPLIDKSNRFNVSWLGDRAVEYTLTLASESHREDVCGTDTATYSLLFAARLPFGCALNDNLAAAEFFAGLSEWIRGRARAHDFPAPDGYSVDSITPANAGVIVAAEANTAEYQLQIRMILEED